MMEPSWSPVAALFALRHLLFLGPLAGTVLLLRRARGQPRRGVGALFAFLYGLSLVFVGHALAVRSGCWTYGGDVLKVLGFPADLWFGGALLWGPVLFLAWPTVSPWLFVVPVVGLNLLVLPALAPLVTPGAGWNLAVVLVFATAHLPALYLARWTAEGTNLPARAALIAVAYGAFAFFVLPTLIMRAMSGGWAALLDRSPVALALAALALLPPVILGLSAVQKFAVHGEGTPIPLDPPRRLVRTGLYAYLANPMQVATALAWVVIGTALGNLWVVLAAAMAVCFVQGLVRWHNRQDLAVRFPEGWHDYRAHVPQWRPRWRPWMPRPAHLTFDPAVPWQRALIGWLARRSATGLVAVAAAGPLRYREPDETRDFRHLAAVAKAFNHLDLAVALLGAAMLLVDLPLRACLAALGGALRVARPTRG